MEWQFATFATEFFDKIPIYNVDSNASSAEFEVAICISLFLILSKALVAMNSRQ